MLTHPTLDQLSALGLHGMAKGFRDMVDNPETTALGHAEWLGILLERARGIITDGQHALDIELAARAQSMADVPDLSWVKRLSALGSAPEVRRGVLLRRG